jgi:3-oxoacyl-[acyl-carrier-protein] synthase-3
MRLRIEDIEYHLPATVVTNDALGRENPHWVMDQVEERSGVLQRHVAAADETALDLAFEACRRLFGRHPEAKGRLDAILFCTQSEDYPMPPDSCILHKLLELPDGVLALDFNLACSGFVYGLALSGGLLSAGFATNILLVTADTYSKFVHPKDRSARVLFGDGAAVTWLSAREEGTSRLIDIACSTSGRDYDKFIIPAGGCRLPRSSRTQVVETDPSGNERTPENIHMSGVDVLNFVKTKVPQQVEALLRRNGLRIEDIDLVIFHQASGMALDSLARRLNVTPERTFANFSRLGNTVSASIPMALKDAMGAGRVRRGDRILLVGFGVGLSYASAILEL